MKYTQQEQEMMQKMLLSPHFTLGEFIRSGTAIRRSIDNVPPDIIFIVRMMLLCENILEPLRKRFGAIPISSGYRCHLLNLAVGGAFGSQHELGEAADIPVASKEKMKQYVDFITENCHFHICAFLQKCYSAVTVHCNITILTEKFHRVADTWLGNAKSGSNINRTDPSAFLG